MGYRDEHPEGCWGTPQWLSDLAREVLGGIDLDPCSTHEDNEVVRADRIFTAEDDGLAQDWSPYKRVFINPPGGPRLVKAFWQRAVEHANHGGLVFWVGFNLGQLRYLKPSPLYEHSAILNKRINFRDPRGTGRQDARYDNYLAVLGDVTEPLALHIPREYAMFSYYNWGDHLP